MGNSSIKYYVTFYWPKNPEKDFQILRHLMFFSQDVGFTVARFEIGPEHYLSLNKEDQKQRSDILNSFETFTMHKEFSSAIEGHQYFEKKIKERLTKIQDSSSSSTEEFLKDANLSVARMFKLPGGKITHVVSTMTPL